MPLYDYECKTCGWRSEYACKIEDEVICKRCLSIMKRVFTKMPLRTYTKRPQDRLWGTSHISSSEKFKEKQKRKGEKK
jgi:putative FmdB family regulatory protein